MSHDRERNPSSIDAIETGAALPPGTNADMPDHADFASCEETVVGAQDCRLADEPALSGSSVKRGRPSLAEAEQLSGRILDASWDVLLETGFESFTFDRVARHARIGKATIYSRFASKHDLLVGLLKRRVAQRTALIQAEGSELPPIEAFTRRATQVLEALGTPDGILLERLIDWLDQERNASRAKASRPDTTCTDSVDAATDASEGVVRAHVYRLAIESISQTLRSAAARNALHIADFDLAAQLWLEGILGHVRFAGTRGPDAATAIRTWARTYTTYFFAGIERLVNDPARPNSPNVAPAG